MIAGELKNKIDSLKTTELGVERIRRNLELGGSDVLAWCRAKIMDENAVLKDGGKTGTSVSAIVS